MARTAVQARAVGVEIKLAVKEDGVPVNLAGATARLVFVKPDGSTVIKSSGAVTIVSESGLYKLKYNTVAGDLTPHGRWGVLGEVTMPGGQILPTSVATFEVLESPGL